MEIILKMQYFCVKNKLHFNNRSFAYFFFQNNFNSDNVSFVYFFVKNELNFNNVSLVYFFFKNKLNFHNRCFAYFFFKNEFISGMDLVRFPSLLKLKLTGNVVNNKNERDSNHPIVTFLNF